MGESGNQQRIIDVRVTWIFAFPVAGPFASQVSMQCKSRRLVVIDWIAGGTEQEKIVSVLTAKLLNQRNGRRYQSRSQD